MTDRLDKRPEGLASLAPMQRAEELLHKMTIEEKAMQLSCLYPIALLGANGSHPKSAKSSNSEQPEKKELL